ncbi:hypothetical protein HOH87_08125 [bacterium]|jgi:hypothetical protein|nr:hypothetical protein [bacterium]
MIPISKETVIAHLEAKAGKGWRTTSYMKAAIQEEYQSLYELKIETIEGFLSLIAEYHPNWNILCQEKNNTIGDLVNRMKDKGMTFQSLSESKQSHYFQSSLKVYDAFSYEAFLPLFITHATEKEQASNPQGTFRIVDGNHRCLVLAYKVFVEGAVFEPFTAIFVTPRLTQWQKFKRKLFK